MTFKVFLQNKSPEGFITNNIDMSILIKKITGNDASSIKYVWYNLNTQSFDDRKTFNTEEDAKWDILKAYYNAKEICGQKIVGISLDYDEEKNIQGEIK
jgi:hypothetical protein